MLVDLRLPRTCWIQEPEGPHRSALLVESARKHVCEGVLAEKLKLKVLWRQGVRVCLEIRKGAEWMQIGADETNSDGRCPRLLPVDHQLVRSITFCHLRACRGC